MPSQIYWHHDDRVLYVKFSGEFKPDNLLQSAEYAANMIDTASQSVHVIMDMRRVGGITKDTMQLRNTLAPMLTHNRLGWTVAITSNVLLQAYLNRAVHRMSSRLGYVNNFSEAVRFVRQVDSGLSLIPISLAEKPLTAHTIR